VLAHHALTEDVLKGLEDDDEISQAFARALAEALVHHGRAAIGNFGVWTVGQKPNLQRFIRFRSRPAINQML
jgi:hypothetical protein